MWKSQALESISVSAILIYNKMVTHSGKCIRESKKGVKQILGRKDSLSY